MSSTQHVDVERTLSNLPQTELAQRDVQAIKEFVNHCAAEGISEVRQDRLISALKNTVLQVAPDGFTLSGAPEQDLKQVVAALNRSDYKPSSLHTMKCAIKKFYKVENGGHNEPEKTKFFTVGNPDTTVTHEDLYTDDELQRLFQSVTSTRDRALLMTFYESAARPEEILSRNIGDFTAKGGGDFLYLTGVKNTPDRTNQLVRSGRPLREWLAQHPCGGELGSIKNPSAPLWVKTEQQQCVHCGEIPHRHDDTGCTYEPDPADRLSYGGFYRRFKQACENADIPENKRRPYNLRHTRLTEVATFMGYEQLNKFAGWKPGSDRAKVYVHLTNDDVNQAIRDEYGLSTADEEAKSMDCPFCSATNQTDHSECRQCGRPLSLEDQTQREEKLAVLERLAELDEQGVLDQLDDLEELSGSPDGS